MGSHMLTMYNKCIYQNRALTYRINCYNGAAFIKHNHNTVHLYSNSYGTISQKPIAVLKNNYYILNLGNENRNIWGLKYWIHKGLFDNLRIEFRRTSNILKFQNGTEIVPYPQMKLGYDNIPINAHPKKYVKKYNEVCALNRSEINAQSRSRYHNKKAVKRMNNAYEYGKLDVSKLPMDDVFKLWNVSHRREIINYYGIDSIIASLNSKVINSSNINGNYYELVVIKMPDNSEMSGFRDATYLRMINPSTSEIHFEGVPNYSKENEQTGLKSATVESALAWRNYDSEGTYNIPKILT